MKYLIAGAVVWTFVLSTVSQAQTLPPIVKTPVVPAGKISQVGFFYAIDPDCSGRGDIESRLNKKPQSGNVDIQPGSGFPRAIASGPYQACNDKKVPGLVITFTPNEGFTGKDTFEIEFFGPRGGDFIWRYYVTVK